MPQKSIKIKICGLTRKKDIGYVNELQPDYIGFVFSPKSRRYVTPEQAAQMRSLLSRNIIPVGVFVNEMPESVADLLNQGVIDMAQLHGQEDEAYISKLRLLTHKPIIQSFSIASGADIQKTEQSMADYILLDNGAGGTGDAFDWSLLQQTVGQDRRTASRQKEVTSPEVGKALQPAHGNILSHPWFLAGGLTPENVGQALEMLRNSTMDGEKTPGETLLYGVDVSSGVETDGRKDYYKIKKFVSEVRKYDQKRVKA